MSYDAIDELLALFDSSKDVLVPLSWAPTKEELLNHNVEENFDKYADFLLFVSESIIENKNNPLAFINLSKEELDETERYIQELFRKYTIE